MFFFGNRPSLRKSVGFIALDVCRNTTITKTKQKSLVHFHTFNLCCLFFVSTDGAGGMLFFRIFGVSMTWRNRWPQRSLNFCPLFYLFFFGRNCRLVKTGQECRENVCHLPIEQSRISCHISNDIRTRCIRNGSGGPIVNVKSQPIGISV